MLNSRAIGFGPEGGLQEAQGHVVAQVRPALASPPPAAGPAETEEILEDIAEAREDVVETAESGEPRALQALVPELVVDLPFLGVAQDLVGFRGFLEAVFRLAVAGVPVRMVLQGEFAIGRFELGVGRLAVDPQDLIVIPFGCHLLTRLSEDGAGTRCPEMD